MGFGEFIQWLAWSKIKLHIGITIFRHHVELSHAFMIFGCLDKLYIQDGDVLLLHHGHNLLHFLVLLLLRRVKLNGFDQPYCPLLYLCALL